jgi:hypothetical protein
MPWRAVSVMDERREFVRLAMMEGANRRELCRRFGISGCWLQVAGAVPGGGRRTDGAFAPSAQQSGPKFSCA